MQAQK